MYYPDYGYSLSGLTDNNMDGQNFDEQNSAINISDVIEVIETDPDFGTVDEEMRPTQDGAGAGFNASQGAHVKILEQPASKALRFRYECEGRSAGSIPGVNSTPENKTFPTIQVVGYKGRAVVVVSCVTKDPPYRPHPHNLVGKESCKKGVCTVEINNDNMIATFANLGIQCVKKKDIEEALKIREEIRVDPFRTKFNHKTQPSSIDLNAVRLCFQVFLEGPAPGKFTIPLPPVTSEPIYDKKAMADLVICKLSHCSGSVVGGNEIILLCEKVAKEDISVRFFEEKDGIVVWEGYGDFTPTQVHKQVAIAFRTPRYRTLEIEQPVQALIQLRRPSDNATSDALPFQITPLDSEAEVLKRKRQKFGNDNEVLRHMHETEQMKLRAAGEVLTVKREPETSPNPYIWQQYGGGASELPPMVNKMSPIYGSRTPSPLGYQANAMHPVSSQVPASIMSPVHPVTAAAVSVAGMSPISQPTQADVTYSGGTVYQAHLGAQYLPSEPRTVGRDNLLDMDAQNCNVDLQLNSKELADLGVLEGSLSANLSISDTVGVRRPDNNQNMTDSLTRLVTSRYNELCDLDMYSGPN